MGGPVLSGRKQRTWSSKPAVTKGIHPRKNRDGFRRQRKILVNGAQSGGNRRGRGA